MKKNRVFKNAHDVIFYVSLVALPVIQFCIFYIGVNFNSILLAFQKFENATFVMSGFGNFADIFGSRFPELLLYSKNSLIFYLVKLLVGVTLSIVFSYYIAKNFRGSGAFKVFIYLPHIISTAVLVVMFKYFAEGGFPQIVKLITGKKGDPLISANPFWSVLVFTIWSGFGVEVLMYVGAIKQISDSIFESAQMDGITPLKEFIYIVVPSIFPTIITFITVGIATLFTIQMNQFTFFGEMNLHKDYQTMGYFIYISVSSQTARYSNYPFVAALGLVLTVITSIVTFGVRGLLNKLDPTKESRA